MCEEHLYIYIYIKRGSNFQLLLCRACVCFCFIIIFLVAWCSFCWFLCLSWVPFFSIFVYFFFFFGNLASKLAACVHVCVCVWYSCVFHMIKGMHVGPWFLCSTLKRLEQARIFLMINRCFDTKEAYQYCKSYMKLPNFYIRYFLQ